MPIFSCNKISDYQDHQRNFRLLRSQITMKSITRKLSRYIQNGKSIRCILCKYKKCLPRYDHSRGTMQSHQAVKHQFWVRHENDSAPHPTHTQILNVSNFSAVTYPILMKSRTDSNCHGDICPITGQNSVKHGVQIIPWTHQP